MTLYGLIGYPLGHSWSARLFNAKFEREGLNARYELFELPSVNDVISLVGGNPAIAGLNVTIPYKQHIISLLDALSPEALEAGAVNTVKIHRGVDGKVSLKGYNTDIAGFRDAVSPLISQVGANKRRALVLGNGGACRAVCVALRAMGWFPIIVSRTSGKDVISYSELTPELVSESSLIVNCTPLGMYPKVKAAPPFPYQYLRAGQICFDLIYNPEETLFMRICRAHDCVVSNGLNMLRFQAEAAWRIWTS